MNLGDIVYDNKFALIESGDFLKLLEKVEPIHPKVILEIGTRQGFSFNAFCEAFQPELAITIDILKKEDMPAHTIIPINDLGTYLWGHDSNSPKTLEEVKSLLAGKQVDFLFIDGDHSEKTAQIDFDFYSPLVRKGGIIAMHDILKVTDHGDNSIQAKLVFDRVKGNYRSEIINETPTGEMKLAIPSGIGLLYV